MVFGGYTETNPPAFWSGAGRDTHQLSLLLGEHHRLDQLTEPLRAMHVPGPVPIDSELVGSGLQVLDVDGVALLVDDLCPIGREGDLGPPEDEVFRLV